MRVGVVSEFASNEEESVPDVGSDYRLGLVHDCLQRYCCLNQLDWWQYRVNMYLSVVCIGNELYEFLPVILVLADVVSKEGY